MQSHINKYQLYNLLFNGNITLEEYLKELNTLSNGNKK